MSKPLTGQEIMLQEIQAMIGGARSPSPLAKEKAKVQYLALQVSKQGGIVLDDSDADKRAKERQAYQDAADKANEENLRRIGRQVHEGANKFRVFKYCDTASIRGEEKALFLEARWRSRY